MQHKGARPIFYGLSASSGRFIASDVTSDTDLRARTAFVRGFSNESRDGAIRNAHAEVEDCFIGLRGTWLNRCGRAELPDGGSGWEAELAVTFTLA